MTKSQAAKIVKTEPQGPVETLQAEQLELRNQFAALDLANSRLQQAQNELQTANRALAALDGAEAAAVAAWTANPIGEAPIGDMVARQSILDRIVRGSTSVQSAQVAANAVRPEQLRLSQRLQSIGAELLAIEVEACVREAIEMHESSRQLIEDAMKPAHVAAGLIVALRAFQNRPIVEKHPLLQSVVGTGLHQLLDLKPFPAEIFLRQAENEAGVWERRLKV